MSYVDQHLLPGEFVNYRTRVHWKLFIVPALILVFVLLPLTIILLVSKKAKAVAILPLGVAVVALAIPHVRRRSAEFAVTNKRVIVKLGIVNTRSIELLLAKVEGVEVMQSVWGRMLGYGDIVVTGSGGTHERFASIQAPLAFRQAVHAAADADRK